MASETIGFSPASRGRTDGRMIQWLIPILCWDGKTILPGILTVIDLHCPEMLGFCGLKGQRAYTLTPPVIPQGEE